MFARIRIILTKRSAFKTEKKPDRARIWIRIEWLF